jgi:hypothetical protein
MVRAFFRPVAAISAVLLGCWAVATVAAEGVLDLPDGGALPGRLAAGPAAAAANGDTLLWQSPLFTQPFAFHIDEIRGARFPQAGGAEPGGAWKVRLRGGDAFAADLEGFDGRQVTVSRGGGRRLRIDRAEVERIVRRGPDLAGVYVGPGGLAGWRQLPAGAWREEAGSIGSETRGAAVEQDVGGAVRAVYDVVLSWRRAAAGRLSLASPAGDKENPYQCELFGAEDDSAEPQLLLVREEKDSAASEPLPEGPRQPAAAARRLRVVLFVDQVKGRLAVVLPDRGAEPLADLVIPPPAGRGHSGRFRLVSGGDIVLESLRVSEWNGERPAVESAMGAAVVRRDGSRVSGDLLSGAEKDGQIVIRNAEGERGIALDEVREIVFAPADAAAHDDGAVRVSGRDDERLVGDLVRVDAEAAWLRRAGIDEPVPMPLDAIVAVESRRRAVAARPVPGRLGRLRHEGTDVAGTVAAAGDAVGWRPVGSMNASPFAVTPGSGAVVEYVARTEAAAEDEVGGLGAQVNQDDEGFFVIVMMRDDGAAAIDGRIQPGDRILAVAPQEGAAFVDTKDLPVETVMNLLRGRIGTPVRLKVAAHDGTAPREVDLLRRTIHVTSAEILQAALADHARLAPGRPAAVRGGDDFSAVVFLRTGDALACAVEAVDQEGIRIRTPLGEASRREAVAVPARLVQAVELVPAASRRVDRARMERLLTLPRMQRANPPTHLVRLVDGDYLRGRVVALDERTLTLALADAVKELSRDAVARLIWLHPEDLDAPPEAAAPAAEEAAGPRVQGVTAGGERVTLVASGVAGTLIQGRSPAIGPAAIDTAVVDRLLVGTAIEAEAREFPYRQWKLKPAPGPRALGPRGDEPRAAEP